MFIDDKLYQSYLEDLQDIERFRASHLELYKDTPLETDDPNVKRLIEALAFFGARARKQGVERMTQIHHTLFRQYFAYLLNPLPSIAMLKIQPSLKHPSKIHLPVGTELFITTPENPKATFQTLEPTDILPIFFKKFTFHQREDHGWTAQLEYQASHITADDPGSLRFYINHLSSFFSSLQVSFALQRTLESAHIIFDDNTENALPIELKFGHKLDRHILKHPIEQVRTLLHFPQQELFFSIHLPPVEKKWQKISLRFQLSPKWPDTMRLTADTFVPFVVPIINLKSEHADPIKCDGTKDRYPILYPEPNQKYSLHTVMHVFENQSDGIRTLKPGILGKRSGSFEVNHFDQSITLDIPGAFADPKTIGVKALWTQSWFGDCINDEHKILFPKQPHLNPNLKILGKIYPYENTFKTDDPNFLLRIFSLKNQNSFFLNELLFIINATKNLDNSLFDIVPDLIKDLQIHYRSKETTTGALVEYEFFLKDWRGQKWELVVLFFWYLHKFLNAWLSHFEIETKVHMPHAKKPLTIGGKDELTTLAQNFFLS